MRTKALAATVATLALPALPSQAAAAPTATAARTKVRVFVRTGVSVRCPRGRTPCTIAVRGEATRASRMVVIGQTTIKLAPGATTKLHFTLNRTGVQLIRANLRLPVKLTVAVRQSAHRPIVLTHTVVVAGLKRS